MATIRTIEQHTLQLNTYAIQPPHRFGLSDGATAAVTK
jgi:hypothetical protein